MEMTSVVHVLESEAGSDGEFKQLRLLLANQPHSSTVAAQPLASLNRLDRDNDVVGVVVLFKSSR